MFQIIPRETHIDFIGKRHISFVLSGVLVLLGLFALVQIWLGNANLGIELEGGTAIQVAFYSDADKKAKLPLEQMPPLEVLRALIANAGVSGAELQNVLGESQVFVRVKSKEAGSQEELTADKRITETLENPETLKELGVGSVDISSESIGPTVGRELRDKAILAILFGTLGLLVYIAIRFDYKFGIVAALATFHDVLAVLGVVYVMNIEITLLIITALLTLAGYSLTDTVVVFDRIRENLRKHARVPFIGLLNSSINQVLSRTLITSLTVLLVLGALFFWGGPVLRDFAFALGLGVVVGTYSSVFVASPLLLVWRGGGGRLLGQVREPAHAHAPPAPSKAKKTEENKKEAREPAQTKK
jgi:preprotein translocase subunit SecF